MKIFGLEKVSLVDYPQHICCVVFTAGCNFRCPYCHNGDLVTLTNLNEICEKDVFDYLSKRAGIIDSVCVSGGEPTLQPDLIDFIKKLRATGLLIKLDTNGTNFSILKTLVENKLVAYVAMDIKTNFDDYYKFGASANALENIKKSVEFLKSGIIDYEFRTTIEEGLINEDNIKKMAQECKGAKRFYLQCFKDNDSNLESGLCAISPAAAKNFKSILEKTIKSVELRGY